MEGCIISDRSVADLVSEMDRGDWSRDFLVGRGLPQPMNPSPKRRSMLVALAVPSAVGCRVPPGPGTSRTDAPVPSAAAELDEPPAPALARLCKIWGPAGFPFSQPDRFTSTWYGKKWRALGEGGLCTEAHGARQVWRFVFVPSFHPTVAVILRQFRDSAVIEAKRLDGAGGYEPGNLVVDTTFTLTTALWSDFEELLAPSGVLTEVKRENVDGLDGAQWVLEWSDGVKYRVVDVWTPRPEGPAGAYRTLGEWFLARSGLIMADEVKGY